MALITNSTTLKSSLSDYLGDTVKAPFYDVYIQLFENWANVNLRLRQMQTSTTLTLASNTATIPTDYLAWRSVEWAGLTPPLVLKWTHPSKILTDDLLTISGSTTEAFTIENTTLTVAPPDTGNHNIKFRYFQKIPGLATTDPNWLITAHPLLYLFGTLTEASRSAGQDTDLATYQQERDKLFAAIVMLDAETQGEDEIRSDEYF